MIRLPEILGKCICTCQLPPQTSLHPLDRWHVQAASGSHLAICRYGRCPWSIPLLCHFICKFEHSIEGPEFARGGSEKNVNMKESGQYILVLHQGAE